MSRRHRPPSHVAVVTDSTASLPAKVAAERGIRVVPLQVVIGGTAYDEGEDAATPDRLAEALQAWVPVSTSRPTPEAMLEAYESLAADGATEIVSVHLSGDLSGTYESAQVAARSASVPVTAVDTRQVGVGTGFCALAAADAVGDGADATEAAERARLRGRAITSLFYVDTLEYLRRGGRMGAAAALVGSALAVKPILHVEEGRVRPYERVRTAGKALARLEELAVAAVGDATADVAVAHLASAARAEQLADRLEQRLGDRLGDPLGGGSSPGRVLLGEVGAVLGAHVGPGMVAVCVAPKEPSSD